jgi:DNA topoisomerase-1
VDVHGSDIVFHFRGKSGKVHTIGIKDDRLARIIHSCEELPGPHLFEYRDAQGECHPIESVHVNAFLRACAGQDCSAKEYRTWKATVLAAHLLQHQQIPTSRRQVQKLLHSLVCHVAQHLGNTPAVCRSYYIHPAVFEAFLEGALHAAFRKISSKHRGLHVAEQAALGILKWYEHRRQKGV